MAGRAERRDKQWAEQCKEYVEVLLPALRMVARRHGYAIGTHGSLSYDIDLIAVPWTDAATQAESLAEDIRKATEAITGLCFISPHEAKTFPEKKPHGRVAWSFHLGGGPYIDLSVTPRIEKKGKK